MGVVADPIWSAGFESGQAFEKSKQSESEKFFAHLNNGEVSLVPEETRLMTHVFRVLITPDKGGDVTLHNVSAGDVVRYLNLAKLTIQEEGFGFDHFAQIERLLSQLEGNK